LLRSSFHSREGSRFIPDDEGTYPVAAYKAWIAAAAITAGRIVRAVDRHGRAAERNSTNVVAEMMMFSSR
jgi:hypothetical protein